LHLVRLLRALLCNDPAGTITVTREIRER